MTKEEIEFTNYWWAALIQDEERLTKWLWKLEDTEFTGYSDHAVFLKSYRHDITERERKIITNIANDELKHSELIVDIIKEMGLEQRPKVVRSSEYWATLNSHVDGPQAYYAANYFGEALASERFEIIFNHPQTTNVIKERLDIILPDEIFHRETLIRLAGNDALARMQHVHKSAFGTFLMKKNG